MNKSQLRYRCPKCRTPVTLVRAARGSDWTWVFPRHWDRSYHACHRSDAPVRDVARLQIYVLCQIYDYCTHEAGHTGDCNNLDKGTIADLRGDVLD